MKTNFSLFSLFSFASLLLSGLVTSSLAPAAGLEKSIPWGGQTSGVAGIGTPYMQGSEALFFNPAGLVSDKVTQDVSLNISPTFPQFQGPILNNSVQETSQSKTLFPSGLIYGATLNDKIGFGVGGYVSGGTYADFTNLSRPPFKGTFEVLGDLSITELAAGVGYKVMDGLKIGASWRVVSAKANFALVVKQQGAAFANSYLHDLKDTEYTGYKLGAQYKINESTQLGLTYRSEVNFKAKGSVDTTVNSTTAITYLPTTGVTVGTTLPAAVTLGATHDFNESWRILGEYVWTQYSKVANLAVDPDGGSGSPTELQLTDQTNLRLAGEYKGMGMPLRFGYIWTSQVTNADYAKAILAPPGSANTLTLGTGQGLNLGTQNLQLDGGVEYTWANANGTTQSAAFQLTEYAVHLGAIYNF